MVHSDAGTQSGILLDQIYRLELWSAASFFHQVWLGQNFIAIFLYVTDHSDPVLFYSHVWLLHCMVNKARLEMHLEV